MAIEKTVFGSATISNSTALFRTRDYHVELITLTQETAPHPLVLRKYAVVHTAHNVVGAIGEQFHASIDIANALQEQLEQAIIGRPPSVGSQPIGKPPVLS